MTGKELYNEHKDKKIMLYGNYVVICGYDEDDLICAILKGDKNWLYEEKYDSEVILKYKNNPLGYTYLDHKYVNILKNPTISIKICRK